jgi:hypothetical protein
MLLQLPNLPSQLNEIAPFIISRKSEPWSVVAVMIWVYEVQEKKKNKDNGVY